MGFGSLEHSFPRSEQAPSKNYYICKLCPLKTKTVSIMERHVPQHKSASNELLFDCMKSPPTPYRCDYCSFKTDFLIKLNLHMIKIHLQIHMSLPEPKVASYMCNSCDYQTFSHLIFVRHNYACKKLPVFPCEQCQFTSKSRKGLKIHYTAKHSNLRNSEWFHCDQCPYQSRHKGGVRAHVLARHTAFEEIDWFQCVYCLHKAKTKGDLRKHIQRIHTRVGIDESKRFECERCSFKTKRKPCLKKHMIVMHSSDGGKQKRTEVTFFCEMCPYKTNRSYNLKTHMKEKHTSPEEIEWFPCEECNYRAKRVSRLKEHILMKHTALNKITWFKCGHCSYKGKLKSNLKAHILTKHITFKVNH